MLVPLEQSVNVSSYFMFTSDVHFFLHIQLFSLLYSKTTRAHCMGLSCNSLKALTYKYFLMYNPKLLQSDTEVLWLPLSNRKADHTESEIVDV